MIDKYQKIRHVWDTHILSKLPHLIKHSFRILELWLKVRPSIWTKMAVTHLCSWKNIQVEFDPSKLTFIASSLSDWRKLFDEKYFQTGKSVKDVENDRSCNKTDKSNCSNGTQRPIGAFSISPIHEAVDFVPWHIFSNIRVWYYIKFA